MELSASDSQLLLDQLDPCLQPGEELLWYGKPDPNVILTRADSWLIPLSLVSLLISCIIGYGVLHGPRPFQLVMVLFLLADLYIVVGRFVYKVLAKQLTAYGVTTTRAIVVVRFSATSVPLPAAPIKVTRSRNGRHASVSIGPDPAPLGGRMLLPKELNGVSIDRYANTGMEPFMRGPKPFGFYDVSDVAAMLQAIDRVQAGSAALPRPRSDAN